MLELQNPLLFSYERFRSQCDTKTAKLFVSSTGFGKTRGVVPDFARSAALKKKKITPLWGTADAGNKGRLRWKSTAVKEVLFEDLECVKIKL